MGATTVTKKVAEIDADHPFLIFNFILRSLVNRGLSITSHRSLPRLCAIGSPQPKKGAIRPFWLSNQKNSFDNTVDLPRKRFVTIKRCAGYRAALAIPVALILTLQSQEAELIAGVLCRVAPETFSTVLFGFGTKYEEPRVLYT